MMVQISANRYRSLRRGAFTLIELLIVVGIVALLSTLGTGAYFRVMLTQQQNTTKATLSKAHSVLHKQWSALSDLARNEVIDPGFASAYEPDIARANWMYARQQATFPRSFAEAFNPTDPNGNAFPMHESYRTYLNNYGITSGSSPAAAHESSACLLMAMQFGVSGTGISPTDLGTNSIATISGIPVIVDSWGQPLTFTYTQSIIPNTTNLQQWSKYQVISSGPDMTYGTTDDISSLSLKN
jgi:prepilin-type N-terminal cleavage/methylation domain-containing protein